MSGMERKMNIDKTDYISKCDANGRKEVRSRSHQNGLSYEQFVRLQTYQKNGSPTKPQEPQIDGRGKNFDQASESKTSPERKGSSLPLTYKEALLQTPQANGCSTKPQELPQTDLGQASENSKPDGDYNNWDEDPIDPPPPPMEEDENSRRFLEKIRQIKGKTIDDIVALIPWKAAGQTVNKIESLPPRQGFQFSWTDPQGSQWTVCAHSPDSRYLLRGWIVRIRRNNEFMDSSGNFHPVKKAQPGGDESIINDTHIPIQTPDPYICPLTHPNEQTEWGREQLQRIANLFGRGQIQS
jgi:hypothetical protein